MLWRQALPQAEGLHDGARAVGERDVAAVFGGLLQGGARLLLEHVHAESGVGQGAGQGQAGRAGADDEDVCR